jgi:branched-chain amino acid transport system substrate-binding protein
LLAGYPLCGKHPYSGTLPLTREFIKAMKEYAPNEPVNFMSLEGYAGAKIAVEALRRAGPAPTRRKVIDALKSMGEYDLGGVSVSYSAKRRLGWRGVHLTIIGGTGKLIR